MRVEAKLKTKTIEQVCAMSRRIEERALERFNQSREVHAEGEKEKEKEDLNDVVPSNIIGQRIYRRLQLYYNMQPVRVGQGRQPWCARSCGRRRRTAGGARTG